MSAQQTEFKETNSTSVATARPEPITENKRSRASAGFLANIQWALGPQRCCYSPL